MSANDDAVLPFVRSEFRRGALGVDEALDEATARAISRVCVLLDSPMVSSRITALARRHFQGVEELVRSLDPELADSPAAVACAATRIIVLHLAKTETKGSV